MASVINERISKATFDESVAQVQGLLQELSKEAVDGVTETTKLFDMAKTITINVLSGAGMGVTVPWDNDNTEKPEPGFKLTYIQSVKAVLDGVAGPVLLPKWFLLNYPRFLPGSEMLRSIGLGVDEFPRHTRNMLQKERERSQDSGGVTTKNNIMSQLLRASERPDDAESHKAGGRQKSLSEEEMLSNLFIFTGAGFDTTVSSTFAARQHLHPSCIVTCEQSADVGTRRTQFRMRWLCWLGTRNGKHGFTKRSIKFYDQHRTKS